MLKIVIVKVTAPATAGNPEHDTRTQPVTPSFAHLRTLEFRHFEKGNKHVAKKSVYLPGSFFT